MPVHFSDEEVAILNEEPARTLRRRFFVAMTSSALGAQVRARPRLGDPEWMRTFRVFINAFNDFVVALDNDRLDRAAIALPTHSHRDHRAASPISSSTFPKLDPNAIAAASAANGSGFVLTAQSRVTRRSASPRSRGLLAPGYSRLSPSVRRYIFRYSDTRIGLPFRLSGVPLAGSCRARSSFRGTNFLQ
jgi:hypothetical protein